MRTSSVSRPKRNEVSSLRVDMGNPGLEPDRFGYRSRHFIVSVNREWLKAPNYRGLSGLKAEIQVRTILMHAWADVEYKLAYKKRNMFPLN